MHPLIVSFGNWAARHTKALIIWTVSVAASIPVGWVLVSKVWPWLQEVALASAGEVGILLALWIAVILTLYALDHFALYPLLKGWFSRRRGVASASSVVLSAEDRETVNDLRVFWNRKGASDAAESMYRLFHDVLEGLKTRSDVFWALLLIPIRESLISTRLAVMEALGGNHPVGVDEIVERFRQFHLAYCNGAKWLQEIEDRYMVIAEVFPEEYATWEKANKRFQASQLALHEWPSLAGQLRIPAGKARTFLSRGGAEVV